MTNIDFYNTNLKQASKRSLTPNQLRPASINRRRKSVPNKLDYKRTCPPILVQIGPVIKPQSVRNNSSTTSADIAKGTKRPCLASGTAWTGVSQRHRGTDSLATSRNATL